jgi:hypothetical protein
VSRRDALPTTTSLPAQSAESPTAETPLPSGAEKEHPTGQASTTPGSASLAVAAGETASVLLLADRPAHGFGAGPAAPPPRAIEAEPDAAAAEQTAPATEAGLPEVAGAVLSVVLPLDLAALDAALESFLDRLEEAGQAVLHTVGGLGPAPWLAALAALLTAYEAARRKPREEETGGVVPGEVVP